MYWSACKSYRMKRHTPEGEEVDTVVTVPSAADDTAEEDSATGERQTDGASHTEIQYRLLEVDSRMGSRLSATQE